MRSSTRLRAVAATLTGLALATTGCSSGSGGSGAAAAPDHPAARSSASDGAKGAPALPKGVKGLTKVPADVPNDPALRARVSQDTCEAVDGGWRAAGTAVNPGKKAATYLVTVFFTTDTATVIGAGRTRVTVEPGATARWTVSDAFTAPKKTLCVLRGVG
jgi:hypothetical protein